MEQSTRRSAVEQPSPVGSGGQATLRRQLDACRGRSATFGRVGLAWPADVGELGIPSGQTAIEQIPAASSSARIDFGRLKRNLKGMDNGFDKLHGLEEALMLANC